MELDRKASEAVKEYKEKGVELEKSKTAEQAQIHSKAKELWDQHNKEAVEKYPQFFAPKDGDEEGNKLLESGYALGARISIPERLIDRKGQPCFSGTSSSCRVRQNRSRNKRLQERLGSVELNSRNTRSPSRTTATAAERLKQGRRHGTGTINGRGALDVLVTRLRRDSTLARIIHLVERAQAQRAPSQAFVDRFARIYTPVVLAVAVIIALARRFWRVPSWSTLGLSIAGSAGHLVSVCPGDFHARVDRVRACGRRHERAC